MQPRNSHAISRCARSKTLHQKCWFIGFLKGDTNLIKEGSFLTTFCSSLSTSWTLCVTYMHTKGMRWQNMVKVTKTFLQWCVMTQLGKKGFTSSLTASNTNRHWGYCICKGKYQSETSDHRIEGYSHLVNSHFVNVDKVGIDKVGRFTILYTFMGPLAIVPAWIFYLKSWLSIPFSL